KEKLVAAIQARFEQEFIGVEFNFSQYIQDNVEEATSGVKGENSVKLFGRDLTFLEAKGSEIKGQMEKIKGIQDLGLFSVLGQPNLLVKINRTESARYGFTAGDVNAVVQTALAGQTATSIYEGERQFPLVARLLPQYRDTVEAIRNIQIASPNSGGPTSYIPLSNVAEVRLESGASYIYRENNERYIPLKFSVRERDLGSTVAEAQQRVTRTVNLPTGYHLEWSGEFGALQDAKARLTIIVPLSMLLILLLLYSLFNSVVKSLLALTTIPFAACGGLLALYVTGLNFSISSAIGFVSLFGVSVMDGILMLTYYTQLHQGGMERVEAIQHALLPAAMSHGIGSQVQRPLATVVVGGMLLAPILTLFVVPILGTFFLPDEQNLKRAKRKLSPGSAPEGAPAE
ncbi:MAG: efflux RND transporter permease subunit, partial [Proteobacteria bacterium]|nr:efflux RND transporter permease subunit [Pseudomonadota bacterium]